MVSPTTAISPSWAVLGGSSLFAFAANTAMTAVGMSAVSPARMQRAIVLLSGWALGSGMRRVVAIEGGSCKDIIWPQTSLGVGLANSALVTLAAALPFPSYISLCKILPFIESLR